MDDLIRTASGQWQEVRPFHGEDARARAADWLRAEATKIIDGVTYHCFGGTMTCDNGGAAVLATRDWKCIRPDMLDWSVNNAS